MSQDEDSRLDEAWHRASDADAGRPSAKTRAAILAEAAAAARRRQPAANAPRYWMRLVAGVAVVGVGVMLWRQTEVRLPGEPPVVTVTAAQEGAPSADSADAATVVQDVQELAATEPPPAPPVPAPKASREQGLAPESRRVPPPDRSAEAAQESAQDFAQPPAASAPRAMDLPAPAPAPPVAVQRSAGEEARAAASDEQDNLEEVQVTGSRVTSRPRAVGPRTMPGAAAAPRNTRAEPSAEDLLRDHFPAQNASAQPHRLWVVLDAAGAVVRMGELAPGERPEEAAMLADGAAPPGSWRTQVLRNERGQRIELAIGRLPR